MKSLKDRLVFQKVWEIWEQTQTDPAYAQMLREMAVLEPKFERIMERLPDEDEEIVRDFVMQCENMSWRMLERACEALLFPKKP